MSCTEVVYSDIVQQLLEKAVRFSVTAEHHGSITSTEPSYAIISKVEAYIRCSSIEKTGGV
ncbi:MAG: hypothetical protein QW794_05110 [Thermosphaera sp.]